MTTYNSGRNVLLGLGGTIDVTPLSDVSDATLTLIGVVTNWDIQAPVGGTLDVENTVAVGNNIVLTTNGSAVTLDSSVLSADAIGALNVEINTGSFTINNDLISAGVLSSGSITFGSSGGTSIVGTTSSFLNVNLLTAITSYQGFTSGLDIIDDRSLAYTGNPLTYTISGTNADQTIAVTSSDGTTFQFATDGSNFTDGTYDTSVTAGPLRFSADGFGGTNVSTQMAQSDFNHDGKSDLLEQNTNGDLVIYTMNGLAVTAATSVGTAGPTWHAVGSADFNGDGQQDILLQNDSGTIVDYLMSGTAYAAGYDLADLASSWHVRGTGDFNGDGKADILVQNDNGSMVLLETNGASVTAAPAVGTLPSGWAVEGVADFYGTGQPDILVQSNSGTLVMYTMSGASITAGAVVANLDAGWHVGGTGDYNGDGKSDILLHNDNGSNVILTMNGAVATAAIGIGNTGAGSSSFVAGVDLTGDGNSGLVVSNAATSTLTGYTLNNMATITAGAVLGAPGAGWNVVGSNPISFIDGTGSNLALTGTPGPDQFNLTSYAAGIHTISNFDPAQDTLALSSAAFPNYATVQANEAPYQGGTFIGLSPNAAIVIQGITPAQLTAANFVLR